MQNNIYVYLLINDDDPHNKRLYATLSLPKAKQIVRIQQAKHVWFDVKRVKLIKPKDRLSKWQLN